MGTTLLRNCRASVSDAETNLMATVPWAALTRRTTTRLQSFSGDRVRELVPFQIGFMS
jgi:Mg2+/citrate symporter